MPGTAPSHSMRFANPIWLSLLVLLPLAWLIRARWSSRQIAILFPSAGLYHSIRPTFWQRISWIPLALRLAAIALLLVALARPQQPNDRTRVPSEGIAIQMVVDCSGSMQ